MLRPADSQGAHVMLIAHHLVVDVMSWEIIVDDLNQLCSNAESDSRAGDKAIPPSYSTWVGALRTWRRHPYLRTAVPRWDASLSQGFESSDRSALVTAADLSEQDSTALLSAARQNLGIAPETLLVGVFAMLLSGYAHADQLRFDVERHGRDAIPELDVYGTVGWFTSLFPVSVAVESNASLVAILRNADAAIKDLPDSGAGFGIGQFLGDASPMRRRNSRWCLNFLGFHRDTCDEGPFFRIASRTIGQDVASGNPETHELTVEAFVEDGCIKIVSRDRRIPARLRSSDFASSFVEALRKAREEIVGLERCIAAIPKASLHVEVDLKELLTELGDA